jgi:NADH-quinone oxidoreductase subunit N
MTFNNIINGFFPEIFLSLCILIQFLYNAYYIVLHQNKGYTFAKNIFYQSFIVLFLTFLLVLHSKNNVKILNNLFIIDNSVHIIKTIFLLVSIISLPLIFNTSLLQKIKVNDIFMLFLLSILAMLLLFGATDMISVYMVLEMQALCFYVFSGSDKRATYSTEISIKYFILSSLASIIFLFGSAMIYLSIGSLNFLTIKALLYEDTFFLDQNFYLIIGVLFIGLAFIFKLGVAPFHFWIIDVYEGSPLYATIIFSILPKFVIFFIFLKFLDIYSLFFSNFFFSLLEFLGLLSAFIGVYFTIYEKKLKRFMVFSILGQFSSVISIL